MNGVERLFAVIVRLPVRAVASFCTAGTEGRVDVGEPALLLPHRGPDGFDDVGLRHESRVSLLGSCF